MKRIIGGVRYDTDRAEEVAPVGAAGLARSDFGWEDTRLYRAGDDWFLAGEGGPRSRWAQPYGQHGWCGGQGIQPLESDEAMELLERFGCTEALERHFADRIVDAGGPPDGLGGPSR